MTERRKWGWIDVLLVLMALAGALLLAREAMQLWVENAHGHTVLVWDYTPSTIELSHFEIERDGTIVGTARADQDSFPLLRAHPVPMDGLAYLYRVRGVGVDGSRGAWSTALQMEPQDPTTCFPVACQ